MKKRISHRSDGSIPFNRQSDCRDRSERLDREAGVLWFDAIDRQKHGRIHSRLFFHNKSVHSFIWIFDRIVVAVEPRINYDSGGKIAKTGGVILSSIQCVSALILHKTVPWLDDVRFWAFFRFFFTKSSRASICRDLNLNRELLRHE